MHFVGQQPTTALYSSSLLVQEGVSFCLEGIIFSQSRMPQLDKFTYFTQFFWSCLFFFTFYIPICNDGDGILGISRILKLRNQLLSHRGNNIRSNDPNRLEDILRKGFSTGVSYMYFSLFEVSQWCNGVDLLGKRRKITLISCFGEISGKVLIVLFLTYLYHSLIKKGLVFMDGQGSLFSVVAPFLEDRGQGSVQPPTPSDTILLPVEEESREGSQSAPARLPPLIPEEERRMELEKELDRLVENAVIPSPSPSERDKLLRAQMELELKLEEALQKEGFSADSVYCYRNEWRRSAFTPDSRPGFISAKAIRNTLSKYQSDIRQSMSFRRLTKEIKMGVIPLRSS